jgi:peptidoglycan/LPS O-acetylase OafA/YrhL
MAARWKGIQITGKYPLSELPAQFLMVHAWPFVSPYHGMTWNNVSWSICAEWFAYLFVFPCCYVWFQKKWNFVAALLLIYVALCAHSLLPERLAALWLPVKITSEFLAGCALWKVCRLSARFMSVSGKLLMASLALGIGACYAPLPVTALQLVLVMLIPTFLAGLTVEQAPVSKLFSMGPVVWLGKLSYALYMGHGVIQKFIKIALPADKFSGEGFLVRLGVFLATWAAILGFACLLYYLVEVPFRGAMRRLWHWEKKEIAVARD